MEYTEDLTKNQWSILLDKIPGTGTTRTVIDPLGPFGAAQGTRTTLPKCFYRVVVEQ